MGYNTLTKGIYLKNASERHPEIHKIPVKCDYMFMAIFLIFIITSIIL